MWRRHALGTAILKLVSDPEQEGAWVMQPEPQPTGLLPSIVPKIETFLADAAERRPWRPSQCGNVL